MCKMSIETGNTEWDVYEDTDLSHDLSAIEHHLVSLPEAIMRNTGLLLCNTPDILHSFIKSLQFQGLVIPETNKIHALTSSEF